MTSDNRWTSDSSLYLTPRRAGTGDAWAAEAAAQGSSGTQRLLLVAEAAPPVSVRDGLSLDRDARAIIRSRLVLKDGHPVEIADSWYPGDIASGTRLADPRKIPGGAPTLLAELGYRAAAAVEDVESRPADGRERELLQLGAGEWVLVVTRTVRAPTGQPFEVSVMTTPGRERRLRYEMKVD